MQIALNRHAGTLIWLKRISNVARLDEHPNANENTSSPVSDGSLPPGPGGLHPTRRRLTTQIHDRLHLGPPAPLPLCPGLSCTSSLRLSVWQGRKELGFHE